MEIMTREQPEIRVYRDIQLARKARSQFISSGCPPQEVRILDAEAVAVTRALTGPPIPEAIAGFIVGAVLTTTPAVIPQTNPIFAGGGLPVVALLVFGGVLAALASYFIVRTHPHPVIERDVEPGDYVVVAPRVERRAA
jgi:hypothetical protein